MIEKKKSIRGIIYVLLLLGAIIVLFYWYSTANSKRIVNQNRNYTFDSARQTASHIEHEFNNAVNRISTYAFLLNASMQDDTVTPEMLHDIEENALFDAICFVNKEGINLASDGQTSDDSDRDYYINGMQGKSGISAELDSRITNKNMVSVYAPLRHDGEIIGVLRGVYSADSYLQQSLSITYFGEKADAFLCMSDGTIIASSKANDLEGNLLEQLIEQDMVDSETADQIRHAFENKENGAFICGENSKTDNVCVIYLPESDYMLVQAFPQSVTKNMVWEANRIGILLEVMLISLFIVYIIFLLLRSRREKKLLEGKNKEMRYIIDGVNTLFSRFVIADFETDTYQYLAETVPEQEGFAISGRYDKFSEYLCSFLVNESERQKFRNLFQKNAVIAELGNDKISVNYEYNVKRDGNIQWEHMNIICLGRKDGKANKVLFIRQNTTEAKEKELRIQAEISIANRKERQYRIAVASNAIYTFEFNLTEDRIEEDIVCVVDGKEVSLLEQAGMKMPCKASQWFNWCMPFIAEESKEDYRNAVNLEYLRNCFQQGDSEIDVEYWNEDSNGGKMCVRQSFLMTKEEGTGDIQVMVVVKDITSQVMEQRQQTQALKEALMQAQHANAAKTTFLSNMSHDIRTPMNAIIGFTTIAVSHIDNKDQVKDCLQKVLASSNHLLSLINDILDMSRIESGKVQIKEQECNIPELMHNLVNIIQPQVKAKQLELFIDTFDIANEDVIADALKLNQVFINLLSNAVKYTPAGGSISFRIIQKTTFRHGYGDYAFIIKDNGIGMSQEFVEHIFEPFEREATTTKTGIQGTGLGMAITKNIIEMMNGTITVQSESGKGSEFRVELTLKLQDTAKNAEQIKELEGLRALVVDDDFHTCDSVSKMLKQIGLRAEWTTSGREAVYRTEIARDEGDLYHTYIIDWQMPEISGVETARRIRRVAGSDAPIIILTAYDWTDIEEDARLAGVTAFCAKPLFMSDLKSALLSANQLIENEEQAEAWTLADFKGKRVLLVEDNELNREIAMEILSETGFIVDTAPDGTDAVEIMKSVDENYYDAILMDVQMPIMDGYEATRTIRTLPRNDVKTLPIIAMTANAMDEDKEAALKNGMNAHIAKPIDVEIFISVLGHFLK